MRRREGKGGRVGRPLRRTKPNRGQKSVWPSRLGPTRANIMDAKNKDKRDANNALNAITCSILTITCALSGTGAWVLGIQASTRTTTAMMYLYTPRRDPQVISQTFEHLRESGNHTGKMARVLHLPLGSHCMNDTTVNERVPQDILSRRKCYFFASHKHRDANTYHSPLGPVCGFGNI